MRFVVIGLGSFGTSTATSLAAKGHEVVVVDGDRDRVDEVKDAVAQAVVADAAKLEVLKSLDFRDCEAVVVCLGPGLEASILVVHYLKQLGVKQIVAKAQSEDHHDLLKLVGADRVIYPEKDEAIRLANVLGRQNVLDYIPLTPEYSLVDVTCPRQYHGKTIRALDVRNRFGILVIGVRDRGSGSLAIPDPDMVLDSAHSLLLLGKEDGIHRFGS